MPSLLDLMQGEGGIGDHDAVGMTDGRSEWDPHPHGYSQMAVDQPPLQKYDLGGLINSTAAISSVQVAEVAAAIARGAFALSDFPSAPGDMERSSSCQVARGCVSCPQRMQDRGVTVPLDHDPWIEALQYPWIMTLG